MVDAALSTAGCSPWSDHVIVDYRISATMNIIVRSGEDGLIPPVLSSHVLTVSVIWHYYL